MASSNTSNNIPPPLPPLPPLVRSIRGHLWTYAEDDLRAHPEKERSQVLESGSPTPHHGWEYWVVRLPNGVLERQTWHNGQRVN